MTTIAIKDGIMACDSRWSYKDAIDSNQTKIRRLQSGALLGSAGDNDCRDLEALFEKVKIPSQLPARRLIMEIRCDYIGLLALPKGRIFKIAATHLSEAHWGAEFQEDIGVWEIQAPFAAVGSGKEFALGAMAAGKSAYEACRIACRFDINSGGTVYQYNVTPPPKKGKK